MYFSNKKDFVREWFHYFEFEGSIIIDLARNTNSNNIILISSYADGLSNSYTHRFRKTVFHNVKELRWPKGIKEGSFKQLLGTSEIEKIQLKTFEVDFEIEIDLGNNLGRLFLRFGSIETKERSGLAKQVSGDFKIFDIGTGEEINFRNPI